mmetsp:Transcript_22460/g.62299  ORF Transcript_22460/g.62299 Transcript_22460/m.62299 type:complete len:219 (+) Transcript_22460:1068-1724(+)
MDLDQEFLLPGDFPYSFDLCNVCVAPIEVDCVLLQDPWISSLQEIILAILSADLPRVHELQGRPGEMAHQHGLTSALANRLDKVALINHHVESKAFSQWLLGIRICDMDQLLGCLGPVCTQQLPQVKELLLTRPTLLWLAGMLAAEHRTRANDDEGIWPSKDVIHTARGGLAFRVVAVAASVGEVPVRDDTGPKELPQHDREIPLPVGRGRTAHSPLV